MTKTNPQSRYQRAIAAMGNVEFLTHREFMKRLATVCETKEQMASMRSELARRGAIKVGVLVVEKT